MNRIVLVGRLDNTPELRHTSTGIPVSNFSLSVRRSIPNGQGRYERDVFRIVTWRKLAETCCRYLERGRMIAVDGKLQNRNISRPGGERRIIVEIHADDVRFLEGAKPRSAPAQRADEPESAEKRAQEPTTDSHEDAKAESQEEDARAEVKDVPSEPEAAAVSDAPTDDNSFFLDDDMGTPIGLDGDGPV